MKTNLIEDYLGAVGWAALSLPPSRSAELQEELRDHIDQALARAGVSDEATVRNVLDKLGSPEEIVAAEAQERDLPVAAVGPTGGASSWWNPEVTTIVLLLFGGFVLFIGWFVGLALLWSSRVWTIKEKVIGTHSFHSDWPL